MNNTLKQLQEKGEEKFRKQFDELGLKQPKNSMKNLERELIIDYWRKQTTLAYNAGKADILDTVLKEIDSLNTVDIKDESDYVVREQLISKDKLKNKLLDNK